MDTQLVETDLRLADLRLDAYELKRSVLLDQPTTTATTKNAVSAEKLIRCVCMGALPIGCNKGIRQVTSRCAVRWQFRST